MIGTLMGQAHGSDRIEILAPPKQVSTESTYFHVVGSSTAPRIKIETPGSQYQIVDVVDGMFHAHIWVGYGLHDVVLSVPESSAVAETLTVLSSPRKEKKYEAFFPWYAFHQDVPPTECLECHAAPSAGAMREDSGNSEWCLKCHDEIRELFRSHTPNQDPTCQDCHRVNSDLTITWAGDFTDKNPCYTCHKDKIGQFEQEYIHGPVAGGTCTVCHSPHGSRFEKNLLNDPGVLCMSCHPMEPDNAKRMQHKPFDNGRCPACHDPHATNNKWVLVKNSEEICLGCHQDGEGGDIQDHTHPYNVKPKSRLRADLTLTAQGRLECLSCHDPHASDSPHLLRTTQANSCLGCHPGHQ